MLSDRDRQELVGLVAKECGTVLSPDDPIFASVVMSERVLEHAASAVASRLARHLEASFAAQELQEAGKSVEARSVWITIVEGWSGSPEAPRALLELARADHPENPGQATVWLERLVVDYPESAMAPIARRLLAEWRTGAVGA